MGSSARRYRIDKVLGQGGFGRVYRAEMIGAGGFARPVALKVLNATTAADGEMAVRLRDEARLLGRLSYRAIVQVLGLVQINRSWTVVMELVGGVNLLQVRSALGRLPVGIVLEVVQEVARALHVAWDHPLEDGSVLRVLHRDIKPSNIQVTLAGEIKVLDWGVARGVLSGREARTQAMVLGSAGYLSPERLMGVDSHAGDVYALTVVLCELLTGTRVHNACTRAPLHAAVVTDTLAELAKVVSDPRILDLAREGLAFDPDTRPTADAFHHRVVRLRRDHPEPLLADWAWSTLPAILRSRVEKDGELTGREFVETWSAPVETVDGHSRLEDGSEAQEAPVPAPRIQPEAEPGDATTPPEAVPTESGARTAFVPLGGAGARAPHAKTPDAIQSGRARPGHVAWLVGLGLAAGLVLVGLQVASGPQRAPLEDPEPLPDAPSAPPDPLALPDPPEVPSPGTADTPSPGIAEGTPRRRGGHTPVSATVARTSAATGRIRIEGDARAVQIRGERGPVPGETVPPGSYAIWADFGGEAGLEKVLLVEVSKGGEVVVRCDRAFEICQVQ
ncbi:MAG: protein kinase [Deltaproteobacteria bacterium]|nr:protein kinase [Deltaproteobacteria bacterium]